MLISFQQPVLLQDSKEECEKGNSSDCCEEEEEDDESGSTCSTSEHEEIEKVSNLSKEDRKLQRKVLRPVEVSFINFNICYRTLLHCTLCTCPALFCPLLGSLVSETLKLNLHKQCGGKRFVTADNYDMRPKQKILKLGRKHWKRELGDKILWKNVRVLL